MSVQLAARRIAAPFRHFGFRRKCNVCGHRILKFEALKSILDGKFSAPLLIEGTWHGVENFETLNAEEFLCPICGSQDKARLNMLYLDDHLADLPHHSNFRLLHFAPEGGLDDAIRRGFPAVEYTTADLERDDVDLVLDVTSMDEISSNSIDAFIFSHILKHVNDEAKALSELRRILKPDGWGIVMVPVMLSIGDTFEDSSVTTPSGRVLHFGLEDHLRVHSRRGFLAQLAAANFVVAEH